MTWHEGCFFVSRRAMKLSIASLSSFSRSVSRSAASPVAKPKAKAPEAPRYAAKMIDLDDDDSPTQLLTRRKTLAATAR